MEISVHSSFFYSYRQLLMTLIFCVQHSNVNFVLVSKKIIFNLVLILMQDENINIIRHSEI